MILIREATEADWPTVWKMFREVAAAGDVFAYDESTTEETARKLWFGPPSVGFVAEHNGQLIGSYFVRPNQPGRGSHVANGGYMVFPEGRGQGVASAMCEHSIAVARKLGFKAMQFNFVVASNTAAIRVWEKHGFSIIGRQPRAFRHESLGFVDALVMFREV
jgi:GNAT superfamily N-acetyltransferase